MSIRNFVVTSFLAALTAASVLAQGSTSTTTVTRNHIFPPVGLGSTETIQVNLVNVATATSTGTQPSCTGSVSFADAKGNVIGGKATSFTTVGTGQILSVPFTFSALGLTGTHSEIVATVSQTLTIPAAAPCSLLFTLETFASVGGETHLFLTSGSAIGPPNGFGR